MRKKTNVKSSYNTKKQWSYIIPTLEFDDVVFKYAKYINVFFTDGEFITVKNKIEFDNIVEENIMRQVYPTKIGFVVNYNRLMNKVEKLYRKSFGE